MNISISPGIVARGILIAGLLLAAAYGVWADEAFTVPVGERQLFLDDVGIAKMVDLKRTMHQPDKKGAVIRPNLETGEHAKQTRTAPVWNPERKIFQFWDLYGNEPPVSNTSGYYESRDGLNWSKPVMGQIEFRGSKENNYIAIPLGGGRRTRPGCVVYDPADPDPSRRYKGFGCVSGGVALGVSPDGTNWKALDVPTISSSDEYNLSFDKKDRLFIATVKHGGPHGRSVHLSTSKDFEHWTRPELIFHADKRDQELGRKNIEARLADGTLESMRYDKPSSYNVDVYNMAVFRYESLYVGTPAMYHATGPHPNYPNTDGFKLVQLVCSRDLKSWKRLGDRKPFIGPSRRDSGAYDLTGIIGPSDAVLRGHELWFYYTGSKYRAAGWDFVGKHPGGEWVPRHGYDKDKTAICLAVLRRDGFISLDAGQKAGSIVTRPFKVPGGRLFVNFNAIAGELRVEVLGESSKVLAASEPIKGDHVRGEVVWKKGNLAALKGKIVSMRFTLRNGRLYSYWFE